MSEQLEIISWDKCRWIGPRRAERRSKVSEICKKEDWSTALKWGMIFFIES